MGWLHLLQMATIFRHGHFVALGANFVILPKLLKDIVYKVLEVITSCLSNLNAHQVSHFYAVRKKIKYKELARKSIWREKATIE